MKKRIILDNKLRKMLVDSLPIGAHLTAIFDSCHSGTLLDLDHYLCNNIYNPRMNPGYRRYKTLWQGVRRKDGEREYNVKENTTRDLVAHAHEGTNSCQLVCQG